MRVRRELARGSLNTKRSVPSATKIRRAFQSPTHDHDPTPDPSLNRKIKVRSRSRRGKSAGSAILTPRGRSLALAHNLTPDPHLNRKARAPRASVSAKGAAFIGSLGQRPRYSCNTKPPALKARFIPAPICVGLRANRCVESRFQRLFIIRSDSWGDAPG